VEGTNAETLPGEQVDRGRKVEGMVGFISTIDTTNPSHRVRLPRKWIINARGYANIVKSPKHVV
jgi:hypothetical protein